MNILNTKEVAEKLNVSSIRIRQLIRDGRLPAKKIGRDFVIDEKDLALVAKRQTGRPPKTENGNKSNETKSFAEAAACYIGSIKDGLPTDLSTNKKHLEGLGRD